MRRTQLFIHTNGAKVAYVAVTRSEDCRYRKIDYNDEFRIIEVDNERTRRIAFTQRGIDNH